MDVGPISRQTANCLRFTYRIAPALVLLFLFSAQATGLEDKIVVANSMACCELNMSGNLHLDFKPDWSLRRLVWAPDGSQLMLSIGQIGIDTPQETGLFDGHHH